MSFILIYDNKERDEHNVTVIKPQHRYIAVLTYLQAVPVQKCVSNCH